MKRKIVPRSEKVSKIIKIYERFNKTRFNSNLRKIKKNC
jgi:hypothetical protein